MALTPQTPGVFIQEVNAFPNSVVTVATAVPAFIGYTSRADYQGKSYVRKPVRINSLYDYLIFFGAMTDGPAPVAAPDLQQYTPIYHVVPAQAAGEVVLGGKPFDVLPDSGSIYYLYNSIKLFYQNGGGTCFVISAGLMGKPTGQTVPPDAPLVNPHVLLADLDEGLQLAAQEPEVTMIVIPDAVLMKEADYATLMTNVLDQCGELQSRVAIMDVYGGEAPDPQTYLDTEIRNFRGDVGLKNLQYGIAYFPFLKTTIVQDADINCLNLGGAKELIAVLPNSGVEPLQSILGQIADPPATNVPSATQLENALLVASAEYQQLHKLALGKINTLPPSGAIAGVYTAVDNSQGVWKAPANVSLVAVTDTTLKITDADQGPLNVDALTGKSINTIRFFPGVGVLVWGARTLDGNSQDWRYVSVRRTVIMIEQSVKQAIAAYVFQPNTAVTWSAVESMINSFLTTIWSQGGLAGATPAAAFGVAVGLGTTMTADDILNGIMRVTVRVAITHPAEFIVITVSQRMQIS